MSVRKRSWKTGAGGIRSAWIADFTDANGNRQRQQFASKSEAKTFCSKAEEHLRNGTFRAEAAKITVREMCDLFISDCEYRKDNNLRMTADTLKLYKGHVLNYICPSVKHSQYHETQVRFFEGSAVFPHGLGEVKLANLNAIMADDFIMELRKIKLSVVTIRKIMMTLNLVVKFARKKNYIATNPIETARVLVPRSEDSVRVTPPEKADMRWLIQEADDAARLHIVFAVATAARAGEQWALRWKHVDFEACKVSIETRVDRYHDEDVPKTKAGIRVLPVAKYVINMLREWRLKSKFSTDDDLIFPNKRGGYLCHSNFVRRNFNPIFDRMKKIHRSNPAIYRKSPEQCHWHALRHFGISAWIAADLNPKTIQTFAGHSSIQYTMDRYGHLFKSDDQQTKVEEIASEMFG